MSYNQELLESRQLKDYIELGKAVTISVSMVLSDIRHENFSIDLNHNHNQQIDKLKNEFISLFNLEKQLNNGINASNKTEEQIRQILNDSENENNIGFNVDINQIFEEKLAQISGENNSKIEDDQKYKDLMAILNEFTDDSQQNNGNNDSNDDELMTIEENERRIPIDPFSKLEIVNPVRNKKCHHIYDREKLKEVIESRQTQEGSIRKTRCPIVGCNNKSVTMDDVEYDRKTKAMIDNIRRHQNN